MVKSFSITATLHKHILYIAHSTSPNLLRSPREGGTAFIILNNKLYAFISTRKASTAKIKPLFTIKLLILPTGAQFQDPGMTLK